MSNTEVSSQQVQEVGHSLAEMEEKVRALSQTLQVMKAAAVSQPTSGRRVAIFTDEDTTEPGVFLQFGLTAVADKRGLASETVGVIETADGSVHLVPTNAFQFKDFSN